MTSAKNLSLNRSSIYIQPKNFADYLSNQREYCLFLDIDGTLANFTLDPKDSVIPYTTLTLLQQLQSHGVKVAVVTGRSLMEARQMLSPIQLPIAATHGLEVVFDKTDNDGASVAPIDTEELTVIRQVIIQSCTPYSDLTIEDKPYSVALHYRQNPTLADVAYAIMSKALENHSHWMLKQGKYVYEIVPKGINKGTAILTLLKKMQVSNDSCPIFIGDDITDEAGFMAIQGENRSIEKYQKPIKGMSIKVGNQPTCAHYYVHDIDEVTMLLNSFLSFYQKHTTLSSELADVNP